MDDPESIRKNWVNHKNSIEIDSREYKSLWRDLEKKFEIDTSDGVFNVLKRFINLKLKNNESFKADRIYFEKPDDKTLIIKGTDSDKRREIHKLCDNLGLHHVSKWSQTKKSKRHLYVYIPDVWSWEFSERNPYSESDDYYKQKDIERNEKREEAQKKLNERKGRKYCCFCSSTGLEAELYVSPYIRGIYCEDCLETVSDGDGGTLNDHKFEPFQW